jgi:GNAT superfamily N-acetyltransferase
LVLAQEFVFVEPKLHDLKGFDCGKPEMNRYLARFAPKHSGLISYTWVLPEIEVQENGKTRIAAYFTLSGATVSKEEIPYEGSLPRYPVPVILLARLAVDRKSQGQKLGGKTLIAALRKASEMESNGLPAPGFILDVLDEDALSFYRHYDMFENFTEDPMRLFVSMSVVHQI